MKIKLPPFIIADIYKDSLVAYNTANTKEKNSETNTNWFSGENKKQVVILIKNTEHNFLSDEYLTLLKSILSACKLTLADVALVNFISHPYQYQQLKELLKPKYVLLFDVSPTDIDLPFRVPFYQVQKHDSCIFIAAPSLQSLSNNDEATKAEKRKLWASLKKMFGV